MAPPSPRRPGFSRRAQYTLFTSYVIAVAGLLLGVLLLITARFDPAGNAAVQQTLSDVFSPVSSLGRRALSGLGATGEEISAYFNAGSKNRAMTRELEAARARLIKGQADALENRRLKRLLGLVEKSEAPVATARLVSSTGSSARRYATLDAGRTQGVRSGLPVIGPEGLVGRIVQVGKFRRGCC
jgi:rod shape-determining protein MreC